MQTDPGWQTSPRNRPQAKDSNACVRYSNTMPRPNKMVTTKLRFAPRMRTSRVVLPGALLNPPLIISHVCI